MKTLESLLGAPTAPELPTEEVRDDAIPERLYTDPEAVGYGDVQIQTDMYNYALKGEIPILGDLSICDIGAGRGDLFGHITDNYPPLNLNYVGIEASQLLAEVGQDKYGAIKGFKMVNADFNTHAFDKKFEVVTMIGSLNLNYGYDVDKWVQLESMLKGAISIAKERVVFIMLHDNGGNDQYISYPVPNMVDHILNYNHPFTVDYGQFESVYKVSINTKDQNVLSYEKQY